MLVSFAIVEMRRSTVKGWWRWLTEDREREMIERER